MTKLNGYQLFGPIEEQTPDPWREEMEHLMSDFNDIIFHIEIIEKDFRKQSVDETDYINLKMQTEYNLGALKNKFHKFLKSNSWAIVEKRNGNNY